MRQKAFQELVVLIIGTKAKVLPTPYEPKRIRPVKHKFSHTLHDVLEYVRLHPELAAEKIKRSKISKAMKSKQIDTYRMHMVLMLDDEALDRFDRTLLDRKARQERFS